MAVVPAQCTDVAGSERVLKGRGRVASFTRIQLMRAGIDLMNTAYNDLDLTPKGREVGSRRRADRERQIRGHSPSQSLSREISD
jgi:predicted dithiol-disulfide oxidoreductase (DUF899 family)